VAHFYRFNPTVIEQSNPFRCWAAALESWLDCIYRAKGKVTSGAWTGSDAATYKVMVGSAWSRDTQSQDDIINQYSADLDDDGGLKKEGLTDIYMSTGMGAKIIDPSKLTYDDVMKPLKSNSHLYLAYFSHTMYHAVVVYGVSTTDGIAVMDPWPGEKLTHRKLSFFRDPIRAGRDIFVGWALK
jgi:Papain-like cysteine protease AvrRpt2